jgi:hypothetical protein
VARLHDPEGQLPQGRNAIWAQLPATVEVSLLVNPRGKFALQRIIRAIPGHPSLDLKEHPEVGAMLVPGIAVGVPREAAQLVQEIFLPTRHESSRFAPPLVPDPVGQHPL